MGSEFSRVPPPELHKILEYDNILYNYQDEITRRYSVFTSQLKQIEKVENSIGDFAKGYENFGIQRMPNNDVVCREWAPGAKGIHLRGDFNDWKEFEWKFEKKDHGKWELTIPANEDGSCRIKHGSKLKLLVETPHEGHQDRLCPWAKYVVQPPEESSGNSLIR